MSKPKDKSKLTPEPEVGFLIKRTGSGYAVFNTNGEKVIEGDVWAITMKKFEALLRKGLGI